MKILFVNNFRYRGGGEEFLLELLPGLSAKGASVGIVCRPNTPLAVMFKDFPVEVFPLEKSGLGGLSSFVKLARIMKDRKYDIVSIQRGHDIIQAWIAALLSGSRPRLVYTVHVADFIASRFLINRMDQVITISRHIARKLESFSGALTGRIKIIPHGIDLTVFNRGAHHRGFIRQRLGIPADTPLISTSGSMWKNQIEFLDALVEIRKMVPDARYLLLTPPADMPQLREFKERAAVLGLTDAVLWHETLPKDDMPSYYADIDLAVSTFRNEGFGLWVIEALAMGVPVVAFDDGGVRDALEGCPAGVLIRNGVKEMAAEVIRILQDPAARKRMSDAGPRWVGQRFNKARMIDDYVAVYRALVDAES